MLGATGVSLGTRLYASPEALSDPEAEAAIASSGADDTIRTEVFDRVRGPAWPAGYDGRALRNRTVDAWHDRPEDLAAHLDEAAADYRASSSEGYAVKPLWVGEGLDLIDAVLPAADIISDVVAQATRSLEAARTHLT
ncbi:MAG: nitronate monooxygenase, partial [Acidimicrobiia bacterium]|nr:nitronate monooxygenase [Acidimicrobiia bacterium]